MERQSHNKGKQAKNEGKKKCINVMEQKREYCDEGNKDKREKMIGCFKV